MMGGAQQRLIKRAVENYGAADAMAEIIAGFEMELLEEIALLHEELDVEYLETLPDEEQRKEALTDLATSKLAGDGEGWYVEYSLQEHLEDAEDAKAYLGLDEDDWTEQVETWADLYRDRGAEGGDRELAALHVERKFDVSLEEFEARVVGWDEAEMLEQQIAGNFQVARDAVRAAREELQEDVDDVDEDVQEDE